MGRKGVISSHETLYSRTERKTAMQIATGPLHQFPGRYLPSPAASNLVRTNCFEYLLINSWRGSWGSLYETQPWLFTLFSIKLHQEKVWDSDGNWQWHFLIFLGLRWPIRSYNKYWNIFFDILTHWKLLELEERYFIHASSSNIGAIWKKSGLWDSLLWNNTPRWTV